MADGISLPRVLPGELIFLNLPDYPGSGAGKLAPKLPSNVTKRVGTNIGTQGIEVSWSAGRDDSWISYYEIFKNGAVIGRSAKGTFFFDRFPGARHDIAASYEVRTVDGDGNRSSLAAAKEIPGDPETHEPLGEFGPVQGKDGWKYEQSFDGLSYKEMTWHIGGYEGSWGGCGLGRIGRIWMQPAAEAEIARTFVIAKNGLAAVSGHLHKDPSAESAFQVFVRIEQNRAQIWPATGWEEVPAFGFPTHFELRDLAVREGDTIRFVVKRNGQPRAEPIIWNPVIMFTAPE